MSPASTLIAGLIALATLPAPRASGQQTSMPFDAALVVADQGSRFEATFDYDGDGYDDVLDWWWSDPGYNSVDVTGWVNDGTGRLQQSWTFSITLPSSSLVPTSAATVGDYNGDGRDDFILAFGDKIHVYLSNGSGLPSPLTTLTVNTAIGVRSLVSADFDLDGDDDFAWGETLVTVMLNTLGEGTGSAFTAAEPAWNTQDVYGVELVAGDVNDDGWPDLLNVRASVLSVFTLSAGLLVNSEGFFGGIGTDEGITPVVGDIDGDLDNDVVLFNEANGLYAVVRNTGAGLVVEPPATGGPATRLFDIDGDGDLDGVCCGGGGGNPDVVNVVPSAFRISLNDGSGSFAPAWTIESLGSHHLAGVVDLDHDGDWDLVAGRTVYYANGPWTAPPQRDLAPLGLAAGSEGLEQGYVSDFDADGDPDLRFGLADVVTGFGDGSFGNQPVVFPDAGNPLQWSGPGWPGDWDGDGDLDLIGTMRDPQTFGVTSFRSNNLLLNNGSGVLSDAGPCTDSTLNMSPSFSTSSWGDPNSFLAADLDGDADLDLVAFGSGLSGGSRLWLNDGSGQFTHAGDMVGRVLFVGLLNGGSLPDLVLNEYSPATGGNQLVVRYGLGSGGFSTGTWTGVAMDSKDRAAVMKLDANETLDIVAVRDGTTSIVALFNDGAGGWTANDSYFLPARAEKDTMQRALATDVDGDGVEDLIVTNANFATNSSWYFHKRPGQAGFELPIQLCFTPTATFDPDGDGDLDLIAHLDESGIDGIVNNRRWTVPADGLRLQYGQGTSGSGGAGPVLGASGPFRLGSSAALHMTGMPGSAIGLLALSFAPSDLPGVPLKATTGYVWPWVTFTLLVAPPGQPGVVNSSSWSLPYVVTQELVDLPGPIYHQLYWQDAGQPFGVSATGGLEIDYQ